MIKERKAVDTLAFILAIAWVWVVLDDLFNLPLKYMVLIVATMTVVFWYLSRPRYKVAELARMETLKKIREESTPPIPGRKME